MNETPFTLPSDCCDPSMCSSAMKCLRNCAQRRVLIVNGDVHLPRELINRLATGYAVRVIDAKPSSAAAETPDEHDIDGYCADCPDKDECDHNEECVKLEAETPAGSETPRTYSEAFVVFVTDSALRSLPVDVVHTSYARTLERELTAARHDWRQEHLAREREHQARLRAEEALTAAQKELEDAKRLFVGRMNEMSQQVDDANRDWRAAQKERETMLAESNIYCRVLTLLGCEEEGDPVEEIQSLQRQWKHAEMRHADAQAALALFGPINGNRADTSLENWFPLTAQELAALRERLAEQAKTIAMLSENWTNTERLLTKAREIAMILQRNLGQAEARAAELARALEKIAHWREGCHAYDADMGNDPREFSDDEQWDIVEACAIDALASRPAKGGQG